MNTTEDLKQTLADLVAIPSPNPPGETRAVCAWIGKRLGKAGYRLHTVAEEPGCDNLVAMMGEGPPHVMFNVHVDTVGVGDAATWDSDPMVLAERDGRLFGLGASNAKSAAAVHIALAEAIAAQGGPKRGTVSFTFVTDDENVGPRGTSFLRRQGVMPDHLIVGAPTGNAIILEERGVMWVAVETRGQAAHAGDPAAGDNAIDRMVRLMARLQSDLGTRIAGRVDGAQRSTMNLGLFNGGSNTNVVPDHCRVEIDRRLLVSETVESAYAEIAACLAAAGEPPGSWSSELMRGTNAFRAPADGVLAMAMAAAVQDATGAAPRYLAALGAGDGRYYADDPVQILCIGPGAGSDSHCANENVSLAEMEESLAIHLAFVARLYETA
jgi:succinyl-diaminopimelate desuccinylase